MKAHEDFISWQKLAPQLQKLENALNTNNITDVQSMLKNLVSGYSPSDAIVDWIHMESVRETENN